MQIHASCAARDDDGVLLLGPSGIGKSDLLLRLLGQGFRLVADDRVDLLDGRAQAPASLAGLLEVRGLGIIRMPYAPSARLALAVRLIAPGACAPARLPAAASFNEPGVPDEPGVWGDHGSELALPTMTLDGRAASAGLRVALALDCATGRVTQVSGVFQP